MNNFVQLSTERTILNVINSFVNYMNEGYSVPLSRRKTVIVTGISVKMVEYTLKNNAEIKLMIDARILENKKNKCRYVK